MVTDLEARLEFGLLALRMVTPILDLPAADMVVLLEREVEGPVVVGALLTCRTLILDIASDPNPFTFSVRSDTRTSQHLLTWWKMAAAVT